MKKNTVLFVLLFCTLCQCAFGSSVFLVKNGNKSFVAKNFDSLNGVGYLIINPRNSINVAIGSRYPAMSWKSFYGSVTFNQLSTNMPVGGMNEEGLVVELLSSSEMSEVKGDNIIMLNEFEAVKYLLDRCKNVEQALEALNEVEIEVFFGNVHYFIADKTGKSAVVEFFDNELVVYDEATPNYIPLLSSGRFIKSLNSVLGDKARDNVGDANFSLICGKLKKKEPKNESEIFELLTQNRTPENKWSIVYSEDKIFFRSVGSPLVKELNMKEISFNILTKRYLSINDLLSSNCVDQFKKLDSRARYDLVINAFQYAPVEYFDEKEQKALAEDNTGELVKVMSKRRSNLGNLKVVVSNLDNDRGMLNVFLFNTKQGFDDAAHYRKARVSVDNETGVANFYNIPRDSNYAIYYYHDENSNEKCDRQWVGLPKEDSGYSKDGGSSFERAMFDYRKLENGGYHIKNRSFLIW